MRNLLKRFAQLHPATKAVIGIGLDYAIVTQVMKWQEPRPMYVGEPSLTTAIVATKDIPAGSTISSVDIRQLTNVAMGEFLPVGHLVTSKSEVIGHAAKLRISAGSYITQEDLGIQPSWLDNFIGRHNFSIEPK